MQWALISCTLWRKIEHSVKEIIWCVCRLCIVCYLLMAKAFQNILSVSVMYSVVMCFICYNLGNNSGDKCQVVTVTNVTFVYWIKYVSVILLCCDVVILYCVIVCLCKEFFKLQFLVTSIQRSREVMQSWSSTVLSTFVASLSSLFLIFKSKPDLVSWVWFIWKILIVFLCMANWWCAGYYF